MSSVVKWWGHGAGMGCRVGIWVYHYANVQKWTFPGISFFVFCAIAIAQNTVKIQKIDHVCDVHKLEYRRPI